MKLECKLDQVIVNKTEAVENVTFLYKPKKEAYHKDVTFKVSGVNSFQILDNLGLPAKLGDVVTLELIKTNIQSELDKGDKHGVQHKGGSKKTRS